MAHNDDQKPGISRDGACANQDPDQKPSTLKDFLELPENQEANIVVPLKWCPHLVEVGSPTSFQASVSDPCLECSNKGENWICLTCFKVFCSRYVNSHMVDHNGNTNHPMALSMADLSVWCYTCDFYVENQALLPFKKALHLNKFGQPMVIPSIELEEN